MGDAKSKAQEAKGYREPETRGTEEVLYRHLWCSLHHDSEHDLRENLAEDVVMIEPAGTLKGHQGVKSSRRLLGDASPDARYEYTSPITSGGDSSIMR